MCLFNFLSLLRTEITKAIIISITANKRFSIVNTPCPVNKLALNMVPTVRSPMPIITDLSILFVIFASFPFEYSIGVQLPESESGMP